MAAAIGRATADHGEHAAAGGDQGAVAFGDAREPHVGRRALRGDAIEAGDDVAGLESPG